MFSMNIQRQCSIKLASLEPTRNVSPKVIKSQFTCCRSSVDETSLANHKTKKSKNPLNNSGLCQYVI